MPIFRRRRFPLGRLFGRLPPPGRQAVMARSALERLRRANGLMGDGAFARAASIYEELADEAQLHGIWRSPQLNLQAGLGWVMAGEAGVGMKRILNGLRLMPEMGQAGRLPVVTARILRNLRDQGFENEAATLERDLHSLLAESHSSIGTSPAPASRFNLPAKCPHCGGSVLPNEIEWVDAQSVICDYCGSLIQSAA